MKTYIPKYGSDRAKNTNEIETRITRWYGFCHDIEDGQELEGPDPVFRIEPDQKIIHVPMGWTFNGRWNDPPGRPIVTTLLTQCQALIVLGYDDEGADGILTKRIGFTHVAAGSPDYVNWNHLLFAMENCTHHCAVIHLNSELGSDYLAKGLLKHIEEAQLQPARFNPSSDCILLFRFHSTATFGIDSDQNVGTWISEDHDLEPIVDQSVRTYFRLNPGDHASPNPKLAAELKTLTPTFSGGMNAIVSTEPENG